MAQFLLPIIFVVLWSSAFVAGKAGVQHATPFAFLAVRFSIVALIFMAVAIGFWIWQHQDRTEAVNAKASDEKNRSNDPILQTAVVGVLIHGAYLGGTRLASYIISYYFNSSFFMLHYNMLISHWGSCCLNRYQFILP